MTFRAIAVSLLASVVALSIPSQSQQPFVIGNPGRASARMAVLLPAGNHSLGDAADFLNVTLRSAWYNEQAWYLYEPSGPTVLGFVVLTKLEQIEASGKSLQDGKRFSLEVRSPEIHSIGDYVHALLSPAPSGRYRTIAIYVTAPDAQPMRQTTLPPPVDLQDATFVAGARQPLTEIHNAPNPTGRTPNAVAYIYEYVKENAEAVPQPVQQSSLDARQHLQKAGLGVLVTGGATP